MDTQDVQKSTEGTQEQTSKMETAQSGDTTQKTETTAQKVEQAAQTLSEERIQQMIAEATQKAVEQGKELGKREMQAIKDREVAEAQKQKRLAEQRAKTYEDSFSGLDEETRQSIELKKLRSENQFYQSAEQQEKARQEQEAYVQKLNETLVGHLKTLGIDPEDKRVDWAKDAPDYLTGRSRFDTSIAKIIKENQKASEDKVASHLKEMESKLRRELGLDSVDTTTSVATSDGIPTDPKKLGEFIAGMSQTEYETKWKLKIDKLRQEGKI